MELRLYRVCRSIHARIDGRGAFLAGGRWNSAGRFVVYMASSISLAVLENLVHMQRADFPAGYVAVEIRVPDDVTILSSEDLDPSGLHSVRVGDQWLESGASAVLRVPSAVVPGEFNYLLNPQHPQFERITIQAVSPFVFDARLFRG
jgi:RES domain-containing protein